MRNNRIAYIGLLLFFFIYSAFSHNYFTSLIYYTLLMLPVISLVHILFTYYNFRFIHEVNDRIFIKGDTVQYTCHIHNNNPFFVYCPMSIRFAHEQLFFKETMTKSYFTLFPGQVKTIDIPIVCQYRGNYNIGVDCIYIMDFFGLIKIKYSFIETLKLLIYPSVEEITSFPIKPVVFENTLSMEKTLLQDKSNMFEIRDYEHGDTLNQIHWKLSAKHGDLKTKNYSSSLQKKTLIFLDSQKMPFDTETNIRLEDLLVESMVSIIHYLLIRQIPVQFLYFDKALTISEGRSYQDWSILYEILAKVQFKTQMNIEEELKQFLVLSRLQVDQQGIQIVIGTHKITDALLSMLITLKIQGYEVVVLVTILDETEDKNLKQLENERIKVYPLKQGYTLQSTIEGDYYVS